MTTMLGMRWFCRRCNSKLDSYSQQCATTNAHPFTNDYKLHAHCTTTIPSSALENKITNLPQHTHTNNNKKLTLVSEIPTATQYMHTYFTFVYLCFLIIYQLSVTVSSSF